MSERKRRSTRRRPRAPSRARFGRDALFAAVRWSVRALIVALVVLGLWSSLRVKQHVEGQGRFSLANWRLKVGNPPNWVTPEIHEDLALSALDLGDDSSLFDRGVLARVRSAIESSPWVRGVSELALSYPTFDEPGVVEAKLHLRYPVALVEFDGRYYLVDPGARRLGAPYRRSPDLRWFRVPLITGAAAGRHAVPAEGEPWSARDVLEGVAVARILHDGGIHRDFPERPIEAIDISNVGGRRDGRESEIVLISAGQRLLWGRSPLARRSRTLSVEGTLENLRRVLATPRSLDFRVIRLDTERVVGER